MLSAPVRQALAVLALVALALFLWQIVYALLLTFAGVLFAVLLRGLAGKVAHWTRLSAGWSLALVVLVLAALLVLAGMSTGQMIAGQLGELRETLMQGIEQARAYLEQTPWGDDVVAGLSQRLQQNGDLFGIAASVFGHAVDAVFALVFIVFAGIYLAAAPRVYTEGTVRLLPEPRRARAREVLGTAGSALWLWLLGQFAMMLTVGVMTAAGLALIGVPLPLALGLIAGLLEFVPFLGPIAAAVPVLVVALTVGPTKVLYAALLLLAIQQIENNLLVPLVERKMVSLAPVLVLVGAVAFTLLFGILGTLLATPLLVVAAVAVKMLYMQDALGERPEVPGAR